MNDRNEFGGRGGTGQRKTSEIRTYTERGRMADFTDDGLYMRHHRTRRGALSARIDDERAERDERDERGAEAPDDSGGGTTTDSPSSSASAYAST